MSHETCQEKGEKEFSGYHVGVAAEAFAAGLLAQAGYDVLVQYGANQPGYDLVAVKEGKRLKVSVKGSQDGGWGLTQGFLTKGEKRPDKYHKAVDDWLEKHGAGLVYMFVQFKGIALGEMPRVFVARGRDVAARLKAARDGDGDTILWESHPWKRGRAKGCIDCVPPQWRFSQERIDSV